MGPSRRTTPSPDAEAEPPPPRGWGRGLAWAAVIIALVVGAIIVSILVAEPDADDQATGPTSDQFCDEAATFRSSFGTLDVGVEGAQQLRVRSDSALDLAAAAPPSIQSDLTAVAIALEGAAQTITTAPTDDPAALATAEAALGASLQSVQEEAERAAAYMNRWCGPAPTEPPSVEESTSTTGAGTDTTPG